MKYVSLHTKNWEIFYGENHIDFSTESEQPVTLIFGINGGGKTALITAMYWAMYGNTDVDRDHSDEPHTLFNDRAKDELKNGEKDEAYVELVFDTGLQDRQIKVKRTITATQNGTTRDDITYSVSVTTTDIQQGEPDKEDNDNIIHKFLDRKLASHFFHAAEQMEYRFGSTKREKELLRDSLFKMVGQIELATAVDGASRAYDRAHETFMRLSQENERVREIAEDINKLEASILKNKENYDLADQELEAAETLYLRYKDELERHEEFAPLIDAVKTAEIAVREAEVDIGTARGELSALASNLWQLPALKIVNVFNEWFAPRAGEFPAIINENLIAYCTSEKQCICGDVLTKEKLATIENLRASADDSAIEKVTLLYNTTKGWEEAVQQLGKDVRTADVKLEAAITAHNNANEGLSNAIDAVKNAGIADDYQEVNIENLQHNFNAQFKAVGEMTKKRDAIQQIIDEENTEVNRLRERVDAEGADIRLKISSAKEKAAHALQQLLKDMKEAHAQICRPMLEQEMNANYWIGKKTRKIKVADDWEILCYDETPGGVGQRQRPSGAEKTLIAYAFAVAVAKLLNEYKVKGLADANIVNPKDLANEDFKRQETFPLVIDAPLNSLGDAFQTEVCKNIHKVLDQVILFSEATNLDKFGLLQDAVGSCYYVQYRGPLQDAFADPDLQTFKFPPNSSDEIRYVEQALETEMGSEIKEVW